MRSVLLWLLAVAVLTARVMQGQGTVEAARAVLVREMPSLAPQIHLALKQGDYAGKPDGFRITGAQGLVRVEAATVPTLLFGVNWYLKYVAHLNVSTNGSELGGPNFRLPAVRGEILRPAIYPLRYALNENTDGYTTAYWDFDRWEHEIDILALSGYNAVLIQRGNDLAVYLALLDVGYKDAAVRSWITQPAHQNWEWMGNMCCFIEPVTRALMERRAKSARRIMGALRSLGMTPVMPGFWGVVPNDFAQHVSGAHVVAQTENWNGFERPGWLDPRGPAFSQLAAAFYRHQRELFGDTTIYDMETFQEGGDAGNVPVGPAAVAIQQALERAHPGTLWFMMAWQTNPNSELVDAVDRSHILIADIEQGRIPRDHREADFKGARWLFGGLWEFGGRTTMGAPLYDYAVRMPRARSAASSHLTGTALFTEGLDTNPFAYDLYSEMAWRAEPVDLATWTAEYALRRYGKADEHAAKAWEILRKTVYGYRADGVRDQGERDAAQESIFNAQPSLDATRTGHWAPDVLRYNADDLRPALTEMLEVAPALRQTASYRYDLTDVTRQVLADEGRRLLPRIKDAYESKNVAEFRFLTALWLEDMRLQNTLLATNEYFLLGRWLSYVPHWSSTDEELKRLNYDARSILTTWGDRSASADLHEYGNKDWSGLIESYYARRWKLYFDSLETALVTGNPPKPIDWYSFGDTWNRSNEHFQAEASGDCYGASMAVARALSLAPASAATRELP